MWYKTFYTIFSKSISFGWIILGNNICNNKLVFLIQLQQHILVFFPEKMSELRTQFSIADQQIQDALKQGLQVPEV